MVRCSIKDCKSDSEKKIIGISFHTFPTEPKLRNLWIEATGKINWVPKKSSRLCSLHFPMTMIIKTGRKTFLDPKAVPTEQVTTSPGPAVAMSATTVVDIDKNLPTTSQHAPDTDKPKPVATSTGPAATMSAMPMDIDQNLPSTSQRAPNADKPKPISPEYTPRTLKRKWKHEKEKSQQRLKKLRSLREKTRRLVKKVANLKDILDELKMKLLITSEDCELLSSIDTTQKDFLRKIFSPGDQKRKYSPSVRKFALCLHFISPRAYSYVRKTFNSCLPHPSTLVSWYKSVDGSPGFTAESLHCIKIIANREQTNGRTLLCSLIIDEMSIRKHVQWNGKNCVGFVNYGEALEGDSVSVAREALVFMVTAINGSWKLPVGYFLVNGCSAVQKANLVKQCIKLLTSSGIKTVSLTFDGCATNIAMAKCLGCVLNPSDINNLKSSFSVSTEELVIFPDPSHMLKLVRNTLGEKQELINGNGQRISWTYILDLHKLQETEGLHLANKLRHQHVEYAKQIMKVRLAAQTFSNSVAEAIHFCDKELHLPEFSSSEATVEFIKNFDILFDILNSRNFNAFSFKRPLTQKNFIETKSFLDKMENYLIGIKLNGQPIMISNRKVGFMGFLICIKSLKIIYDNYVEPGILKFVPTYKFSQDHLECFFSSIRAKGGFNNNPTAIQFESAYKRLIIHGEIKHISSGNCISLEDIKILTFSEVRPETKLNLCSKLSESVTVGDTQDSLRCVIDNDHDYLADPTRLTIYAHEVITYIGGFIIRKLRKIIKCEDCLLALVTEKYISIIEKRDKGGLIYPSKDVVKICEHAEKIFRGCSHQGISFFKESNLIDKLILACFKSCANSREIFQNPHFDSQPFIGNHRTLLIKSISMHYFETRMHHSVKVQFAPQHRIRNIHTKLILFQGQ